MQSKQYILFLSGLDKKVKEADLHRMFSDYPVSYIKIAKDHQTKESFGYAFIGIKNSAQKAEEAIERFNYQKIPGFPKTLRICWYNMDRSGIKNKDSVNVFVKKIPSEVSHQAFHDYYAKFGNIVSLKIAESDEGESLGYGFVMFETEDEAKRAINETNEKPFPGAKDTKPLWVGHFIKNKPKKPITYNNLFVKNIPKDFSEDKIKSIFSKFGKLGSCLIKPPKTEVDSKVPEEKRKTIMNHKSAFICFEDAKGAMDAMNEVPYFKLNDKAYNDRLQQIVELIRKKSPKDISSDHFNKFAVYLVENHNGEKAFANEETFNDAHTKYLELMKEFDGSYYIKDKEDRIECCQALKKAERERKVKAIYEKIKKQIKERFKLCNLYIKNLPDHFDDVLLRDLFQPYGEIRSVKTIKKELLTSYLGIKRSVKVFGYVCFNDKKEAHDAKDALQGKQIGNHNTKLYVEYHQTKSERHDFLKLNMINKSAKQFNKPGMMGGMPRNAPQSKYF